MRGSGIHPYLEDSKACMERVFTQMLANGEAPLAWGVVTKSSLEELGKHHIESAWHSQRVGYYSTQVASYLHYSTRRIVRVGAGGLLHDIGKLDIPKGVLDDERENAFRRHFLTIKEHPRYSYYRILDMNRNGRLGEEWSVVAYLAHIHHQFTENREPYFNPKELPPLPEVVTQEEVEEEGWIINLVDVFDSMHRRRSCEQRGMGNSPKDIREELIGSFPSRGDFIVELFDNHVLPDTILPPRG